MTLIFINEDTINSTRTTKKSSKRNKQIVEDKVPLLPKKIGDTGEFDGASFTGAVFNLSTTIVGSGMMAMPATMNVLGLVPGIVMIIFVMFFTEASVEFLLRFSRAAKARSYGEVMGDAFGVTGRMVYQAVVAIGILGNLIVYMIILGDVLSGTTSLGVHHSGVLEEWFGEHVWNGRFFVVLVITLAVFCPLACFKRIDSLKYTSALSVALAGVFVVITAGIAIVKLINGRIGMPKLFPDVIDVAGFCKLFTAVPVLVTAYVCHFNVQAIENELEDSFHIQSVVRVSLSLSSTVYIATSIFAFLLFGDSTLGDVLANFNTDLGIPYSSLVNDVVRLSYAVHLMLVFPIVFFALRLNLDGLLFPSEKPLASDNGRFALITTGLLIVMFMGANFITNIWDVFQFFGATSAVCVGFIFPASITLKDSNGIATKKDKIISIFMILLAVFANMVAIYSDAYALIYKNPTPTT